MRPAPSLAGLIEIRGLGIRRLPYEPVAVVGLVIDLAASDAERLPPAGGQPDGRFPVSNCRGLPSRRMPTPCRCSSALGSRPMAGG